MSLSFILFPRLLILFLSKESNSRMQQSLPIILYHPSGKPVLLGFSMVPSLQALMNIQLCAVSNAGSDAMVKKATRYFNLWKFLFLFSWAPLDYHRQEWLWRPYAPGAIRTFHRRIIQVPAFTRLGQRTGLWTHSLLSDPWQKFCPPITDWHGVPLPSYGMGYKENVT